MFDRQDVKLAIHADLGIKWQDCSDSLDYKGSDNNLYMEPYYRELMEKHPDLRVMLYSGDDDR
jgi:hypothetical protein